MIDLDEIIAYHKIYGGNEMIKRCMKDAVNQVLDMVAEEAELTNNDSSANYGSRFFYNGDKFVQVDKDSILSIKDKIK